MGFLLNPFRFVSDFDPLSLSPKLWLDATDLSSLTLSGTDVTTWGDKSGNGYDFSQATPANKPVVDSATTPTKITFTAANSEFLDGTSHISNFTSDSQGEVVMVANSGTGNDSIIFAFSTVNSNNRWMAWRIDDSTNNYRLNWKDSGSLQTYNIAYNDFDVTNVTNGLSNGTSYDIYVDNNNGYTSGGTDNGNWLSDITTPPNSLKICSIDRTSSSANYYDGDVYEILYFSAPLSTADRTDLYNYLALKHGVWTPLSLTPKLWLDATDLSTLTLSGTDVTTWGDKSGNGYDFSQATPANKPVVDSATTPTKITFTAANSEYLDGSSHISNFTSDSQGEFVIVGDPLLTTLTYWLHFSNTTTNDYWLGLMNYMTNNWQSITRRTTSGTFSYASNSNAGDLAVYNFASNGTGYEMLHNNVDLGVVDSDDGFWISDLATSPDSFKIAMLDRNTSDLFYQQDVREILYFNAPLSTEQRTNLYDYLVDKHGL